MAVQLRQAVNGNGSERVLLGMMKPLSRARWRPSAVGGIATMMHVTVSDVRLEKDERGGVWSVTADVTLGAGTRVRASFTVEQALEADIIERVE